MYTWITKLQNICGWKEPIRFVGPLTPKLLVSAELLKLNHIT